ncbi:two-component system, cell cycle response regulator [Gammaproteobacteria bacterium]
MRVSSVDLNRSTETDETTMNNLVVLYVEDEVDIREELVEFLEKRVRRVLVAGDGRTALSIYLQERPDLLITDIRMPFMDGLTLVEAVRREDPDLPVIVTTAHNDDAYFMRAIELAVDHYVLKPTVPHVLLRAIYKSVQVLIRKREREEASHYHRFILDLYPGLVLVIRKGEIEYLNRTFLTYLGEETGCSTEKIDEKYLGERLVTPEGTTLQSFWGNGWVSVLGEIAQQPKLVHLRPKPGGEILPTPLILTCKSMEGQGRVICSLADVTLLEKDRKELEKKAFTDPLTGICNRGRLEGMINAEIKRSLRHGIPLSCILFDIDHFKDVNDTYGHQIGDDVLIALTLLVSKNLRAFDILARWGGEEFMVLSPENDVAGTRDLAERLRAEIARYPFPIVGQVTCSFGVSQLQGKDSLRDFMERADQALYLAKRGGRNQVAAG